YDSLRQLQQQQQFQRPTPPASSPVPQINLGGPSNISSSKPTIDCSAPRTVLGLILCNDENAARADWDVNASGWAYAATLEEMPREAFWQSHDDWVQSVSRKCNLTRAMSSSERACVVNTYRVRAGVLQSKLIGDALAEAKLAPEQRADIQARLVSMGFLADKPDGEFGPNTRAAIRKFQQANGFEERKFLTAQQRETLLASGPRMGSQAQTFPTTPHQSQSQLYPQIPNSRQSEAFPDASRSNQPQFPSTPTNQVETSISRGQSPLTRITE